MQNITVSLSGTYKIIYNENPFVFKALRNGEEWRDLTGDNLMLALVYRVIELERGEG